MRHLPNWVEGYLTYSKDSEPPKIFHRWVAVSTIAAALQRKVWFNFGILRTYANFYTVLVGDPGTGKGVALAHGERLLQEVGIPLGANSGTKEGLARDMIESVNVYQDMKGKDVEHRSLSLFVPEAATILKHKDRDLISWLVDWWDAKDEWKKTTVKNGVEVVRGVWLNMLTATTPSSIEQLITDNDIGGGLTARIVFVYAISKANVSVIPRFSKESRKMMGSLVEDLKEIHNLKGEFTLADGVHEVMQDWYEDSQINPPFDIPQLAFYAERRRHHLIKLMMVMSAAKSDDLVITTADFEDALRLMLETEKHMPTVFKHFGSGMMGPTSLVKWVEDRGEVRSPELVKEFTPVFGARKLGEYVTLMMGEGRLYAIRKNGSPEVFIRASSRKYADASRVKLIES